MNTTAAALSLDNIALHRTDVLRSAVRLASWKPDDLRAEASTLVDGCHVASPYLTAEQVTTTVAGITAQADGIEEAGKAARAELDRRAAKAKPVRVGYVA